AYAGGDGGDAAGHGFEGSEAEGLHFAGHEHEVGKGEEFVDVVLFAQEVNAVLDVVFAGEVFSDAAVWAVADEQEARRHRFSNAGEDLDDILDAFDRAEVGEVNEETLVGFGEAG